MGVLWVGNFRLASKCVCVCVCSGVWGEKERDRIPEPLEAEVQWSRMLVATRPATIGWEL